MRVTFDLSSDAQSSESLPSTDPGLSRTVSNNEILYNQKGQQVQRLIIDGVEIMVPLPSETPIETEPDANDTEIVLTDLPPSPQPQITATKRKLNYLPSSRLIFPRNSIRKLDKDQRRRELYSSIYSEMSEVIDASVEGSVRGGDEEEEDHELDETEGENFPQLIATQELNPSLSKENGTPSEASINSSRKRIRQLADALYLEAQEVEREGQKKRVLDSSSIPNHSLPQSGSQTVSPQGYVIVRGDEGRFNAQTTIDEFDPDVDSLFLTHEEQRKK